jgi:hypothetical protein
MRLWSSRADAWCESNIAWAIVAAALAAFILLNIPQ